MGNKKLKQQTKQEWTRQEGRQLFGEGELQAFSAGDFPE